MPIGLQGEMYASDLKESIKNSFKRCLVRNKQLIHIDLSYARLTDLEFDEFIDTIAKSPSLLALHATGNSITDKCKEKTLTKLGGVKLAKNKDDIFDKLHGFKQYAKISHDKKYILWKVREEPGLCFSNTWVEAEECYICQCWRYTVFLFSKELVPKYFKGLEY